MISYAYLMFFGYLHGKGLEKMMERLSRRGPFYINFSVKAAIKPRKKNLTLRLSSPFFSALFLVGSLKFGYGETFFIFVMLTTWFALLIVYDIRYFLLPNYLTISLYLIGLFVSYCRDSEHTLLVIAMSGLGLFFILSGLNAIYYWYRNEYGLGGGDIKLLVALTPWYAPTEMIYILIFSTFSALIWIIIIWFVKRKTLLKIPFGPFIVFGAWIILIYN